MRLEIFQYPGAAFGVALAEGGHPRIVCNVLQCPWWLVFAAEFHMPHVIHRLQRTEVIAGDY